MDDGYGSCGVVPKYYLKHKQRNYPFEKKLKTQNTKELITRNINERVLSKMCEKKNTKSKKDIRTKMENI